MSIRRQSQTLLASAARTAAITSAEFSAEEAICSVFVFDCTVDPASASITPSIEGKDPESGNLYTILAAAAVSSVSTVELKVGKDITAAANVAANTMLPEIFRVSVAVADADSITYSFSVTHMVDN